MLKDDTNNNLDSQKSNEDYRSIDYSIQEVLKNLRKEKKLSIEDLSSATGLSKSILSKIESGEKKLSISNARVLIDFYNPNKSVRDKIMNYIRDYNGYKFDNLENISVNDLMRNLRIDKLLNQTEAQNLSGISDSIIQAIESGGKNLTAKTFLKLLPVYEPEPKALEKILEFLQQKGESMTTILMSCLKEIKSIKSSALSTK
jgi:transcriptional regulator with XRE-family HTH domain